MTNREWLESLDNKELASQMINPCKHCSICKVEEKITCIDGIKMWLEEQHKEKK